eukprot:883-Pyramimonas_sp.AAC.1
MLEEGDRLPQPIRTQDIPLALAVYQHRLPVAILAQAILAQADSRYIVVSWGVPGRPGGAGAARRPWAGVSPLLVVPARRGRCLPAPPWASGGSAV